MICEACLAVPLDLFLPLSAKATRFKDGKTWHGAWMLFEGPDALDRLAASAALGCQLCNIVQGVLERAQPLWAVKQFQGTPHNMLLRPPKQGGSGFPEGVSFKVTMAGEMVISDGKRTGGVYWEMPSMSNGQSKAIVNTRADCDENFFTALNWSLTCLKEHPSCRASIEEGGYLPSRLIFLDHDADANIFPRLVETSSQKLDPLDTQYVALSHCWGTDQGKAVPKTTKAKLANHVESIDLASLPKTFTDAMVATLRLGVQYIWIDSLCIIQDDKDDFSRECSQMHLIYSKSMCTIAASDSPNGDGGCFLPRIASQVQPCKVKLKNNNFPYQRDGIMDIIWGRFPNDPDDGEVTIYPNFGPWITALQHGAVFSRGWCLQERELSPRVLHYTRDRLLWECRECTASEDEPELESKATNASLAPHLSRFRVLDDQQLYTYSNTQSGVTKQVHKWDKVVEAYSQKKLTVSSDKLPAISGVAAVIAKLHNAQDDYLAGLWKNNLVHGLAWFPKRTTAPTPLGQGQWPPAAVDEGIPSWSWAAYDGGIYFCGETWFVGGWAKTIDKDGNEEWAKSGPEIAVQDASTTLATSDRYGRVSSGTVTLTGWAAEATVSETDVLPTIQSATRGIKAVPFASKCYAPQGSLPGATICFDNDAADLPTTEILCLQFGTGKTVNGTGMKADVGLVLRRVPGREGENVYQRLGMFDVAENSKAVWHEKREKRTVTII